MGWLTTKKFPNFKVPGRLPGLNNFYMAGQWANPSGGVPVGLITGRWSIMRLCRDDNKKFLTKKYEIDDRLMDELIHKPVLLCLHNQASELH